MRQHKKNLGLYRLNVAIPKDFHEWLKASAKTQNKTQGLYLTEILEMVRKLKEDA
jgi:hypothetical protein